MFASLELPIVLCATLAATLAVTSARRGAWIALAVFAICTTTLEYRPVSVIPLGLATRLGAIAFGLAIAIPDGLFQWGGLRKDLAPRSLAQTLIAHPVVVASAAAGLLLGLIPLALPIDDASAPIRAAGIALLLIGTPPLITSRYVEATGRAGVVAISGTLLLRASIFGPLEPAAAAACAGGLAAILIVSSRVAGQLAGDAAE
jgi:hypothetical protein